MKVSVTVLFTGETMRMADSVWLALVVAPMEVKNVIEAPGASITEASFSTELYKLLAKTNIVIEGKPWRVGVDCQFESEAKTL